MDLATTVLLQIIATGTKSLDLSTIKDPFVRKFTDTLADGTAIDQADQSWHDQRTLAASTADQLDLAGGLTDAFGDTVTFARVKSILIINTTTTVGATLLVGGGSNAFVNWVANSTDELRIREGGAFWIYTPDVTAYAVTAGTGDILEITNESGSDSVVYDIAIIGSTA